MSIRGKASSEARSGSRKRPGNGHGGRRRHQPGRPPDERGLGAARGINWTRVRRCARLGAERETIILALGFTSTQLASPDVLQRLQHEMARGSALHQLDLLEDIERLRKGGDGSVNATLASLCQALGWDRPDSAKGRERRRPDTEAAVAEVDRLLRRFRAPR